MSVASPSHRPTFDAAILEPTAGRRIDLERVRRAVAGARRAGRTTLLEPEGLEVLDAVGITVPEWVFVPIECLRAGGGIEPRDLAGLHANRVVVKVVAESIAHKTELGGVRVVEPDAMVVTAEMADMVERLEADDPAGCLAAAYVEHDPSIAGELLVALRWTADFGPIVAVGGGGILAEPLAADLRPGAGLAIVSVDARNDDEIEAALRAAAVVRLATEPQRGRPPVLPMTALVDVVERLLVLGRACAPAELIELEVNPLAVVPRPIAARSVATDPAAANRFATDPVAADPVPANRLVALDVLARVGDPAAAGEARRDPPVSRIERLLAPGSMAIVGVSTGQNIGHTILRNTLRDGFDPGAITVVKPGAAEIDGCRCVPDLGSLPGRVDLLVVAVSAAAAAALIPEAIDRDVAESIIVIPGGLDETVGGAGHARRIREALAGARQSPGGGPVLNGGNCMGIRSRPGRYDTLFVPEAKLAGPGGRSAPLAILAQSGAFAITRLSRLEGIDPRYVITVGNQMDLTVGDHLANLASDPAIRIVGVYVEGFAPLDGLRFLRAAKAIRRRGGTVVLYRAGRTAAGARASASHTAAIAGDAVVTASLARAAGVLVAETLQEFDDLLGTLVRLDGRSIGVGRVGALTNAGFECVAVADSLGRLPMATFEATTTGRLEAILVERGLAGVVEVHNPFDLTPMGDDAALVQVAEAILADANVDVAVVGNVPFTQTMRTLPGEGLADPGTVGTRLIELWARTTKAWVTVVDGGSRYDALARHLEAAGIPTFRTADAAIRTLASVVAQAGPGPAPV